MPPVWNSEQAGPGKSPLGKCQAGDHPLLLRDSQARPGPQFPCRTPLLPSLPTPRQTSQTDNGGAPQTEGRTHGTTPARFGEHRGEDGVPTDSGAGLTSEWLGGFPRPCGENQEGQLAAAGRESAWPLKAASHLYSAPQRGRDGGQGSDLSSSSWAKLDSDSGGGVTWALTGTRTQVSTGPAKSIHTHTCGYSHRDVVSTHTNTCA